MKRSRTPLGNEVRKELQALAPSVTKRSLSLFQLSEKMLNRLDYLTAFILIAKRFSYAYRAFFRRNRGRAFPGARELNAQLHTLRDHLEALRLDKARNEKKLPMTKKLRKKFNVA